MMRFVLVIAICLFTSMCAVTVVRADVSVTLLSGETTGGKLISIDRDQVSVTATSGQTRQVPLKEVLTISFSDKAVAATSKLDSAIVLRTRDGSRLLASELTATNESFQIKSLALGAAQIPTNSVSSIRFSKSDPNTASSWSELLERDSQNDILVVQKGQQVLDSIPGVVGTIDDENVGFFFNDRQMSVQRTKLFGVIYANDAGFRVGKATSHIRLSSGEIISAQAVTGTENEITIDPVAGEPLTVPAQNIVEIDYGLGRIRYLADMEPKSYRNRLSPIHKFTDDSKWPLLPNRNPHGMPLKVGKEIYSKGISIHAESIVVYRLANEYREFRSIVGIDRNVNPYRGNVGLLIEADGRELFKEMIDVSDEPRILELDVSDKRELKIHVDFGANKWDSIGDNLSFAEARLIK